MKKVIILLTLAIAAGSYYFYSEDFFSDKSNDLWSYVPQHSIVIYESTTAAQTYNNIIKTKVGNSLLRISSVNELNDCIQELDTLNNEKGALGVLLKGKFLTSVHVTAKNRLGIAIYKTLDTEDQKKEFTSLIDFYKKSERYSFSSRTYLGRSIFELVNKESKSILSYFIDSNTLVASFTPFLVEDVIRLISGESQSFIEKNEGLRQLPKLANDEGNVYLNPTRFSQLIEVFRASNISSASLLKNLAQSSFLDLNVDDKGVYLNGFTEVGEGDFLEIFKGQKAVSVNTKYLVPNSATYLLSLSFNNPGQLVNELYSYLEETESSISKSQKAFREKYGVNIEATSWLDNTIGLVGLEGGSGQLLLVSASDVNQALNQLNTLGESVAKTKGDSVYVERYSSYEIRELEAPNYPKLIFMPFMHDMNESYYTVIDTYVIFSNSIQNLKNLINEIEKENTWGRSVVYNSFLDKTLEESNLSFTINTERFSENISGELDNYWANFLKENTSTINNFYLASFQLSKLDNNFYTSVVIGHRESKEVTSQNFRITQQVDLPARVESKPFVVKNHISNLREVVVVDSSHNLLLIANDGSISWSKPLEESLVGEIEQIDYYKNGKLQYFFATKTQLHIIDRNGNYIEQFPKRLDHEVYFSKGIDYDNSKRYRFLTTDDRGNIFLFNKEGDLLDGWTPRKSSGTLTSTPYQIRVRRKDCFVVATSSGIVSLLNRKGEYLSGFPLDLEARLNTGINVEIGSDFTNTIFSTITRDGRLVKFNMEGQILETNQLYKPTKESEFRIVPDALGKSYVIVRKDLNRVVILDDSGDELLAKDYFDAEEMIIQYYDFSANNKLYAVTDKIQGFTYLYNNQGRLVNSRPVNSEFEIGVIYSEVRDDLKVYCVSDNHFKILQFK